MFLPHILKYTEIYCSSGGHAVSRGIEANTNKKIEEQLTYLFQLCFMGDSSFVNSGGRSPSATLPLYDIAAVSSSRTVLCRALEVIRRRATAALGSYQYSGSGSPFTHLFDQETHKVHAVSFYLRLARRLFISNTNTSTSSIHIHLGESNDSAG